MGGYDITCDPGDLYTRKCYVNVHSPSGCVASDPACTITQQEIISYTSGGDPISKGPSANKWQAWVPTLTSLDYTGTAYQPYGEAGLPFTATGIAGYSDTPFTDGGSSDSGSTDSQVKSDGVSGGSAASKKGIPTWIGVIGAVGAIAGGVFGYKKWKAKQGTSVRSAEGEQSHLFGVDAVASGSWHCGKCRSTWDTKDDAEACCPTYSCPHCNENVTEIHVIESYSCPNCSADLGFGDIHKTAHPEWVGDRVIKNAELGKDSCCCGATAADPCACMIQGVMDCNATCPCSLAKKGAESFDARKHTKCPECGGSFTEDEWEDRHSDPEGYDVHEDCCRHCARHGAESFEAPYGGKDALMGITQKTDLSDFTPDELAKSSAIHGDFNKASLDYSGHQNIQVRSAEDEEGFMAESSNTVWLVNSALDGIWEQAELHRNESKARARLEEFIKDLGGDPKDAIHDDWVADEGNRQATMYQVTIQESESEMK